MNILIFAGLSALFTLYSMAAIETSEIKPSGVSIQVTTLKLERPQYEWVRCNCPNGSELGLTESDFIKHQMYMAGLEHEAENCQADPVYHFPERREYAKR